MLVILVWISWKLLIGLLNWWCLCMYGIIMFMVVVIRFSGLLDSIMCL